MTAAPLIIGTRGSKLALWQAHHIAERLGALGHPCRLEVISTKGDRVQDIGFDKLEGKGFFTKELEEALLAGRIDLAVHSCKDLETTSPPGLSITAIAGRAACEELLIARPEAVDLKLGLQLRAEAVVGTSSARRKAQLRAFRPDVRIMDLRGNVPTRVDKLRSGTYDAIVLAKAGIDRLGLDLGDLQAAVLDPRWFVPAPAQGALAVQTRTGDARVNDAVVLLRDPHAAVTAEAERDVLRTYRGGCQVPLGVHVRRTADGFALWAAASRTAEEMPRWCFLTGADPVGLAQQAVRYLQAPLKPLRVLITRELAPDDLFVRALTAHGLHPIGVPLFTPVPLPFTAPADHERIFFSSRNGVRAFVEGGGDPRSAPCDAIGEGTAEELRKHGVEPGFIGDGPDPEAIAKAYAARFGAVPVLFPCAPEGQRTVQQAMPPEHVRDLVVYRMQALADVELPAHDVAILTSPDNAEAFHALHPLSASRMVIAMGTRTAECAHALGCPDVVVPWASHGQALLTATLMIASGLDRDL